MKNNPLIIDLRSFLPWHKRYASGTSTAVMWAVWLLLWRPLLLVMGIMSLQKQHLLTHLFSAFGLGIEHGIMALFSCSIILLLWSNFMPKLTVKKTASKTLHDYEQYFNLPINKIEAGQSQKITVIHHDDSGHIIQIESIL